MNKKLLSFLISGIVVSGFVFYVFAQEKHVPKLPEIPGITADDKFPRSCVDCHRVYLVQKADYRLSTILKKWEKELDSKYFEQAKASMSSDVKLKGTHPDVQSLVEVIPDDCLKCHGSQAKKAPPFSKLLHLIHLTGGKDNHYLLHFKGSCMHCHKLDKKTGMWGLGSGKEK